MVIQMHDNYSQLVEKAILCHENNRNPAGITDEDVCLARLYSYAFRVQTIGAFHATRVAIESLSPAGPLSTSYRTRAVEALADLANQALDPVPADFRAVISTLYRYHVGTLRVLESIERDHADSADAELLHVGRRFRQIVQQITTSGGIYLTRDVDAPEQACFIVPNLGIVIVPLVYGEHHSWNLAWLAGEARNVPTHRHHCGAEIHLGYNPTHGETVLGAHRTAVDEGYAMPIPPGTDHGWVNTSEETHHVPFVFGSWPYSGWGVLLDVEPQATSVDDLELVERDAAPFIQMVYLEREIARAEAEEAASSCRSTLIPAAVTDRNGSGGLELGVTRVTPEGFAFPVDEYRIVSVVRGSGFVEIEGTTSPVHASDHFGIPAGMNARLKQASSTPMVILDALIIEPGKVSV